MKKGIKLPTVLVGSFEILSFTSNMYVFSSNYFINDSKSPIIERGFIYSTSDNSPNFSNKTRISNVTYYRNNYRFETSVTLSINASTYFLRAYVIDNNNQVSFSNLYTFLTATKDPGFQQAEE